MAIRAEYEKFVETAEKFMTEFDLSRGYFSLKASGNGRLIDRLYAGGRVWPEVIDRAESWMKSERKRRRAKSKLAKARSSSVSS